MRGQALTNRGKQAYHDVSGLRVQVFEDCQIGDQTVKGGADRLGGNVRYKTRQAGQ